MFEHALDEENFSWGEPVLDESGEFLDAVMPDTAAEQPNFEGEINTSVNDDTDALVSEPSVAENDDPNEDERRVEEPDIMAEGSRDIDHDQLRQSLKQFRRMERLPELCLEKEEEMVKDMESRLKKARVNVSELLHDAFLVKAARSKEKQLHGLNGCEKLLFFEAVSKQWNAWQENAAASAILPAEAKVIWRTLKKQGLQDRIMQSRLVLVDNEGKGTAEIRRHPRALWFLDTPMRTCWTFAETRQPLVLRPSMSCWLLVPVRDEKSGFC